jgi:hypothetical protein
MLLKPGLVLFVGVHNIDPATVFYLLYGTKARVVGLKKLNHRVMRPQK